MYKRWSERRSVGPATAASRFAGVAFALALATTSLTAATNAHADDASNAAQAQFLFDQARALMTQKDYAQACPKFAASQRKDPAPGTLLDLANCYEKNGQTASAWVTFKDAATASEASGRKEWATRARERAAALEPMLARLTIHAPNAVPGLVVTRDGDVVSAGEMDVALPADPGSHTVDATAPGKAPFHAAITLDAHGQNGEVTIPLLADAPVAVDPNARPVVTPAPPTTAVPANAKAPSTTGDSPSQKGSSPLRTAGYVAGAVGIAGLGVSVVGLIVSVVKNSSAKGPCPVSGPCADHQAVEDADSAHAWGNVATAGLIGGGVLLAAGASLVLFAPPPDSAPKASSAPSALLIAPWWKNGQINGERAAGLSFEGLFP